MCDEKGHIAIYCAKNKGKKMRYHVHSIEDDEPVKKSAREDSSSDEEYVLISTLTGMVTHGSNVWLVDTRASKHMTRFKLSFTHMTKESPHNVKLGDDCQYLIKGVGEASYKLDSGKSIKMKDVLYVPGLKKNLLSMSNLDAKGLRVAFVGGQVPLERI